jgi:hypothetical protein
LFADRLEAAWDGGRPTPGVAYERLGRAYLAFARDEPAYFSAMFESGLNLADHPEVRRAGDRAFEALRAASEGIVATLPEGRRPPALMLALHMWSLAHGIAALFARGDGARRTIPMSAEDLLEAATLVYFSGLGLPPGDKP